MTRKTVAALAAAAMLAVGISAGVSMAGSTLTTDAPKSESAVKTITGKSACATCEGVTSDGHAILLIQKDGTRWVLDGDSASYKAAHELRKMGKTITATLAGEPVTKKDSDGKEFKEVKVSEVKIDA
jgi:methionine-rich copper-binding protein CopC